MTETSRSGVLRRNLMLGGMTVATSRAFGQTAKPLRLGYLNSLTGGAAYQAENNLNGMKLFFDSVGWTVAGRKLEIVVEDDQFNPQVGLQKAKKLMESDEVELIVGVQASNVALAVLNYMKQREGIFVVSGAGTNQLTADPYAYLFRTSLSTYQLCEPMAAWASANLGKEAITVVSDYAGGRDVVANFRTAYEGAGGKVVQQLFPPLGTKDFGPYLIEVRSKAPPLVYAFMPGIEIVRFVQLFGDMQLQSKTKLTGFALADSQILSTIGKKALGTYTSTTFTDTIDSPQSKQFVQAYRAKYGAFPDLYSEYGYVAGQAIVDAVTATKGDLFDKPKLAQAMLNVRFDAPRGKFRFDPATHNPVQDIHICRLAELDGGRIGYEIVSTIQNVRDPGKAG